MSASFKKRIVVLISGNGTNLQALIEQCARGGIKGEIVAVFSNVAGVKGLEKARLAAIPALTLEHHEFNTRQQFDQALLTAIDTHKPDVIVLAGFMRILTPGFVRQYHGKMFNIHPSLLPKYPGLHTHRQALAAGDRYHGSSVHFVTEELDGGPLVAQARLEIRANDTEQTLARRIQQLEHQLYPAVLASFCADRLRLTAEGAEIDRPIPIPSEIPHQ